MKYGKEEGEVCERGGCSGTMQFPKKDDNCYCHLSPPCHICVESEPICEECGCAVGECEDDPPINNSFLPDWMRGM